MKKIAIFFYGDHPSGRFIPVGEFIIREPFFRYLHNKQYELTMVTEKKDFMELSPFNKYFKKIISLNNFLNSQEKYDLIIMAQNYTNLPFKEIKEKAKYLISYSHQNLYKHPSLWKYIDYFPRYYIGGRHELQRAFDVLNIKIDLQNKENWPKLDYNAKTKNIISFVIFDEKIFKSLNAERNAKIIKNILKKYSKYKIILIGDKNALSNTEKTLKLINSRNIINKVSKTNAKQLVNIIASSKLIISPDTATAHLAAALNIPAIVYYTKTSLERWKPLSDKVFQLKVSVKGSFDKIEKLASQII